ncbi:hypothetical protein CASFOL_021155 [Castilleja foliolosa]|uniref:Growth-regulating factor n=1 Tax=Castilleja foliolosa TaxID=1961234 RepID=A0ABD3CVR4_9LAMI
MDFGLADSLVCSNPATSASNNGSLFALDNNNNAEEANNSKHQQQQRFCGFGFLKQERAVNVNDDDLRDFNKIPKISSLQRSNGCNSSDGHQQMLSFSSPISQAMAMPYYHRASTGLVRNTGYGCSGINASSMQQGVLSGVRGPFTPSQWMELEHQALIYKYITANVPIPSYLLNPIRKAFESVGFSSFPGFRSNALGWGAFHLGFSSTDPEPGRCRRTDGKKWRCSRDAVVDQKYCERHMNRGRHRSRKPVEGQSGQSASGGPATRGKPTTASSASVPPGGSAVLSHPSGIPNINNRSIADKDKADGLSYPHNVKQTYTGSSGPEFGLVCSDSLLNPLDQSSSLVHNKNYNNNNTSDNKSPHPLRQFMDDWPKNDPNPNRTQLSISITPMNEKITASPPSLSHELEMGLGVGPVSVGRSQSRQTNWFPISWEPSMGGPLGEVLHTTSNNTTPGELCRNTKPLNLIDMWDNSPRLASSPTGVLQRGPFGSLSNGSAGSSPRAEIICNGPGLMNPSLPAL